ncbi:hypothetical protein D1007_31070 [Hordeum vulgare]|uniref:KIB1-4 beta-propeller domain-containing protein n=1 Tax=Hordeum vulgare subsp. vulgare TaxID=112509 RepID=A0A8I6Y3N1_HORVV|nr:uncharacterized protein LOC123404302 [Hordeum vulgare subsp. vulgare]KAE8794196.1 hypothetical protein D1007_31070 [Hordeum vulgare]KAI4981300.1 hypothetical protein ZWY2020_021785 [Hordeum vulgare]
MPYRDWANLPELPLAEVLRGLLPCIRSLYAFAGTCHPWRSLLRASAADLIRPRVPPLLLLCPDFRLVPFSPLVAPQSLSYPIPAPADGATLLSVSRGHLILLHRGVFNSLHLVDALTGAERRALQLPSPHFPYHYAALAPSHLLLFHSMHAFFSLPFPEHPIPNNNNARPNWTKHALPRAASIVTTVLEFRGRVLGLTDRAQILEFHLGGAPSNQAVQLLPTTGLPDATTFDRLRFGPHLVAAGDRLLLVLFMLEANLGPVVFRVPRVNKVGVYALDLVHMMWEEVDNIGAYTLFVDIAGRSTVACVDVGNCGVEENRVYVGVPNCRAWRRPLPPGWEATPNGEGFGLNSRVTLARRPLPSPISVHPPLFF